MATPAADAALRAALARLQGAQLVGAINSLGARADKDAVSALRRIAQRDDDFPAAGSALLALARIGTPEATATVRKTLGEGPIELREAAAVAALQVGDDKAADGKLITAALWYDAVRNEAGVPKQARLAATRGAILARGDAGLPDLLEALRSGDEDMRAVGLRTIREVQGAGVLPALVAELERLPAPTRAQALSALADRVDPGVLSVVERHGRSGELEVRLAAVRALGRVGGATSLPLLLQALASRAADERDAAQRSLAVIRIPEADTTLIHALDASSGEARVKLIAILGERNVDAATPALLRFARDPDPALRGAALRALALVARPGDIDALIRLSLEGADEEARLLADRAIYGAAMKILDPALRAEPLVAALRATVGAGKRAALLRPLGAVVRAMGGNEAARIAVAGALHDSDAGVRTAAVKTLSDWPDATAVAPLLDYLRAQPPEPQRALALSGVVRLAANVAAGRDKTALDVGATFRAAHALVRTDPDRMQLVSGLGSLARPESLELLQPYLALPAVKTEASLAVLQIAPTLLRGKDAAATKAALARIAAEDKDADIRAQADRLLKEGPPQAVKKGKKKA
ncbi:MAG TPA: HEAT repeat domain-containing protein [Opitutaceae bacterium]